MQSGRPAAQFADGPPRIKDSELQRRPNIVRAGVPQRSCACLSVRVRSLRRAKRIARAGPMGDGISDERQARLREQSRPGSEPSGVVKRLSRSRTRYSASRGGPRASWKRATVATASPDFARAHLEADPVQGQRLTEPVGESVDLDHRLHDHRRLTGRQSFGRHAIAVRPRAANRLLPPARQ